MKLTTKFAGDCMEKQHKVVVVIINYVFMQKDLSKKQETLGSLSQCARKD